MKRTRVLFVALFLSIVIAITAWSKEIANQLKDNKGHFIPQKISKESSLSIAIKNNDTTKIESLINDGWDVNSPDENNRTALHYAIMNNDVERVKLLLQHGADVNAGSENGRAPLLEAISDRNIDTMAVLIDYNANVNCQDENLLTPLHYATALGFNEGVELLLEHGADPEAKTKKDGSTPLHMAVIEGRKEITEMLLQHNANRNALSNYNQTPLNIASYAYSYVYHNRQAVIDSGKVNAEKINEYLNGYREIIELLMDYGARVSLHDAVLFEDMNCVKKLLTNGADINAQDRVQMTALHHAAGTNQVQMVEFLLSQDNIDLAIKAQNGMTALDMALAIGHKDITDLIKNHTQKDK